MFGDLKTYCEQTSLHGWYYIAKDKKIWKIVWSVIVLASVAVASLFIYEAAEEFTKSTVVTTIQSTTVPLSEVYFPAVTVCNINQVRKIHEITKMFLRWVEIGRVSEMYKIPTASTKCSSQ